MIDLYRGLGLGVPALMDIAALIARVVVEFIRSFSRDWHPKGLTVVILEVIMTVTDPPVKLLRRLIPQLTIGAVRLDLSIMVLLLVVFIGMQVALNAAS